jgi:hypothetical protein
MLRPLILSAVATLALLSAAPAKDCAPVETAPGVKTKPAGCVDLGREALPKKPEDSRLRGADGYIVNRDGTRIRVFGRAGVEVGTGSR